MDVLQSYTASVAPPSIALALMSWERARVLSEDPDFSRPTSRYCECYTCVIHFATLDRITVRGAP